MPIILKSDLIIKEPKPVETRGGVVSSLADLRNKLTPEPKKNKQDTTPTTYTVKKSRIVDDKLIQYRESSFLNDMLSTNKE